MDIETKEYVSIDHLFGNPCFLSVHIRQMRCSFRLSFDERRFQTNKGFTGCIN